MGIYSAFAWFASQTRAVTNMTSYVISSLSFWQYDSYVKVDKDDIEKSIADVVTSEFQDAISTTEDLLRSIDFFRIGSSQKSEKSLLVY